MTREGGATFRWTSDLESTYFFSANRNKESIVLDLKPPEGQHALAELVRRADVLVENFRTGVLERLGFGVERLHALNPRLVVLSISGSRTSCSRCRSSAGTNASPRGGGTAVSPTPERLPDSRHDSKAARLPLDGSIAALLSALRLAPTSMSRPGQPAAAAARRDPRTPATNAVASSSAAVPAPAANTWKSGRTSTTSAPRSPAATATGPVLLAWGS